MKLTEFMSQDAVIADLQSKDRGGVLRELAKVIKRLDSNLVEEEIFQVLMEREKLGSTGIGLGVAIPHGKLAAAKQMMACFGRSEAGVDFQSQDGEPTHLFFALIAPENCAGLHLKVLSRLSRLLKDKNFRESLIHLKTSKELFEKISEEDEK